MICGPVGHSSVEDDGAVPEDEHAMLEVEAHGVGQHPPLDIAADAHLSLIHI